MRLRSHPQKPYPVVDKTQNDDKPTRDMQPTVRPDRLSIQAALEDDERFNDLFKSLSGLIVILKIINNDQQLCINVIKHLFKHQETFDKLFKSSFDVAFIAQDDEIPNEVKNRIMEFIITHANEFNRLIEKNDLKRLGNLFPQFATIFAAGNIEEARKQADEYTKTHPSF